MDKAKSVNARSYRYKLVGTRGARPLVSVRYCALDAARVMVRELQRPGSLTVEVSDIETQTTTNLPPRTVSRTICAADLLRAEGSGRMAARELLVELKARLRDAPRQFRDAGPPPPTEDASALKQNRFNSAERFELIGRVQKELAALNDKMKAEIERVDMQLDRLRNDMRRDIAKVRVRETVPLRPCPPSVTTYCGSGKAF